LKTPVAIFPHFHKLHVESFLVVPPPRFERSSDFMLFSVTMHRGVLPPPSSSSDAFFGWAVFLPACWMRSISLFHPNSGTLEKSLSFFLFKWWDATQGRFSLLNDCGPYGFPPLPGFAQNSFFDGNVSFPAPFSLPSYFPPFFPSTRPFFFSWPNPDPPSIGQNDVLSLF